MNKHYSVVRPIMKRLIFSASLLSIASPLVMAQEETTGARPSEASVALPSIKNMRSEQRLLQNPPTSRPATRPSAGPGAFETYAATVTGQGLKIFGKDLFSDVPSTFAPFDGAQVNQDYIIGTGDELQIRGWGMVDIDISTTVDRSGAIYIPRVGSVKISGVKYGDLQGYLKKAVGKFFTNFELTASIAQTRAVQIYVVGHAIRPGTYTLSAMSTLLNALFTSGGPDASGTMRNIQVKRGGQVVTTFDLYDMLINGDKSKDVNLRDGDVIYIPEAGSLVALTGNVKQQAIFELKGRTSLADLISWSGGFDSAAEMKTVIVEKNVDNQYQSVAELVADNTLSKSQLATIPVMPTDVLRVFSPGAVPVQVQIKNEYVRVSGEVHQSGVFQLRKGETLRELIVRLGGVNENGYVFATQLSRESVRRSQQARLNEVADRFERELEANAAQRIGTTSDRENALKLATEAEQQRRIVQRLRGIRAEGRIVLELQSDNAEIKNLPDLPLRDGDSVYVPRKPGTVDVLGSVFQQNSFLYSPHRTVGDYLQKSGGVTITGDKSEMYVIRADGSALSSQGTSLFSGLSSQILYPGDTVVVPEKIERSSFMQNLKEWTAIFYQFGLGAAGLKVLKD